jgi:uncharacterized DUF497 family protein
MNIETIIWLRDIIENIERKHHVTTEEVEQVFSNRPRFRFLEKGRVEGEDLYAAMGQTDEERYVIVYFIRKPQHEALVIGARDMENDERGKHGKK